MFRSLNRVVFPAVQRRMMSGESGESGIPGSGVGKGGGGGGSIRSAGGAFGKREAALEDQFFYEENKEKIHVLHDELEHKKHEHDDAAHKKDDAKTKTKK